jgi:hypothetical protein
MRLSFAYCCTVAALLVGTIVPYCVSSGLLITRQRYSPTSNEV